MRSLSTVCGGHPPAVIFEDLKWETPYGFCAGVRIAPPRISDDLMESAGLCGVHPEEIRFTAGMPECRVLDWIAGRTALRKAMRRCKASCTGPLFSTPRGAPRMPPGFAGSVSHKTSGTETVAVALASAAKNGRIGVDLEIVDDPRESIAGLVLTPDEAACIREFPESERWSRILLHFSLKESVYKAVDPVLQRYIDYQEASVHPAANGSAEILWRTPALRKMDVEAVWTTREKYILTSARLNQMEI